MKNKRQTFSSLDEDNDNGRDTELNNTWRLESVKLSTAVLCPKRAASSASRAFDTSIHVNARSCKTQRR